MVQRFWEWTFVSVRARRVKILERRRSSLPICVSRRRSKPFSVEPRHQSRILGHSGRETSHVVAVHAEQFGRIGGQQPLIGKLRGVTVVVPQHATEPFSAEDLGFATADFVSRLDDLVVEPLVISFGMIMEDEFANGVSQ